MILPMIGMNWNEYCLYTLDHRQRPASSAKRQEQGKAHSLNKGLVTFPNSNTPSLPPGFKTRWASLRTAGRDVQFLIPKAIV